MDTELKISEFTYSCRQFDFLFLMSVYIQVGIVKGYERRFRYN